MRRIARQYWAVLSILWSDYVFISGIQRAKFNLNAYGVCCGEEQRHGRAAERKKLSVRRKVRFTDKLTPGERRTVYTLRVVVLLIGSLLPG